MKNSSRKSSVILEGQDPKIKEIRNRLPEPSGYPDLVIYVLEKPAIQYLLVDPNNFAEIEVVKVEFERTLIHKPGVTFWAWICTKDGCYYF